MKRNAVGLIPCAGKGTRFNWTLPKEMFPYDYEDVNGKIYPKPISRHVFDLMKLADAKKIFFIINSSKIAVLDYYGSGSRFNVKVGYLIQEQPTGLTRAIEAIDGFFSEDDVILFGMPDTLIEPKDVFVVLKENLLVNDADISIGLFLSNNPEMFAPVILDENERFVACEDKPRVPKSNWTWGAMAFDKKYIEISKMVKCNSNNEAQVADSLNRAKEEGLKIEVHKFHEGKYYDLGIYGNVLNYFRKNDLER